MTARFFDFYWTVYVPDHSAPLNRWVHFLSNVAAVTTLLAAVLTGFTPLYALALWFQMGPPYLGHILFEKTHRSIDQAPIFAALGSWYTTTQIVLGRQCITHGPACPPPPVPARPPKQVLFELLQRHGRGLHSFMVLEPGLDLWIAEDQGAAVAYADRGGTWVTAGCPICPPDRLPDVTAAFVHAARDAGRDVAFFGVGQDFANRCGLDVLPLGRAPLWDPRDWPETLTKARKLRNRLSKGRREGITVTTPTEVAPGTALRADLTALTTRWVEAHAMPKMGFMVTLELFEHAPERRYFVAEHRGHTVGFAVCVPIYEDGGWLLEDLVIEPGGPAGCAEVLIDAAMCRLGEEGAPLVTLGIVPLAGIDEEDDRRHPLLMTLLRTCARTPSALYNFEGLHRFRRKLQPAAWETLYLAAPRAVTGWTLRAVLMAFAEGWLPRFALRVLARWARRRVFGRAT